MNSNRRVIAEADRDRYAARYSACSGVLGAAELEVLGVNYRASGYTTRDQADWMGRLLSVGKDELLVDIGSGAGWPGLYLADRLDCRVVTVDPVVEGGRAVQRRAVEDGMEARAFSIVGSGDQLPIKPRSAAGVVHSDVFMLNSPEALRAESVVSNTETRGAHRLFRHRTGRRA